MPPHCDALSLLFFLVTLALNLGRDLAPPAYRRFMPVPMAIGECSRGTEFRKRCRMDGEVVPKGVACTHAEDSSDPSASYSSVFYGFRSMASIGNAGYMAIPVTLSDPAAIPSPPDIPLYLGAYLAVDMCIGSTINLVWAWIDPVGQEALSMAVAAGLLVGDGVWTVPASLLAMGNVRAPMCMAFEEEAWTAR
jgi:hypothetical protein